MHSNSDLDIVHTNLDDASSYRDLIDAERELGRRGENARVWGLQGTYSSIS